MESFMTFDPLLNSGMLVRAVIVDDQMEVQALRNISVDLSEEFEKLLVSVPVKTRADDPPVQHIERGK